MNLVYSNNVAELFLSFTLNFSVQLYDEEGVVQERNGGSLPPMLGEVVARPLFIVRIIISGVSSVWNGEGSGRL